MRVFALFFLLATAVSASAQGPLTAPDDRVTIPTDTEFTLHNPTAEPIALDSLVFRWSGAVYGGRGVAGTTTTGWVQCLFYVYDPGPEPCIPSGIALAPGESVVFDSGYDPCPTCRPYGPSPPDSLLVYAGGSAVPTRVVLDASGFVASEPGPDGDAALTVGPTPASTRATVRFTLAAPASSAVVAVMDALGRRVAVLHDGPLAAGQSVLVADTSRLPAGVYVVRMEAGGTVASARLVVAR